MMGIILASGAAAWFSMMMLDRDPPPPPSTPPQTQTSDSNATVIWSGPSLQVTGNSCAAIQDCCTQAVFRQSSDPRAAQCPLLDEIARQDKIIGDLKAQLAAKR